MLQPIVKLIYLFISPKKTNKDNELFNVPKTDS